MGPQVASKEPDRELQERGSTLPRPERERGRGDGAPERERYTCVDTHLHLAFASCFIRPCSDLPSRSCSRALADTDIRDGCGAVDAPGPPQIPPPPPEAVEHHSRGASGRTPSRGRHPRNVQEDLSRVADRNPDWPFSSPAAAAAAAKADRGGAAFAAAMSVSGTTSLAPALLPPPPPVAGERKRRLDDVERDRFGHGNQER
jgi:hypothetical protein